MFIRDREGRPYVTVCLEDIAEKLDETMDHWTQYMNVATGEFESLPDGVYIEPDEELMERIDGSDDYLRLPDQHDIHEYRIMERFAEATPDRRKREKLFQALNMKRPFRRFKDEINYHGLAEAYYAFRFLAFIEIAKEWCEEYDIPYTTRENRKGGS